MILDELLAIAPHVRVVTIDTGVLFEETLATWRAFEERFGVRIEVQEALGTPPWTGPEHCCGAQKVAALERALAGADAWITGLRREQGPTRAGTELVEVDDKRGGGSRSTTRSRSGPSATSGRASTSATCPTTRCTTRATPRSAARRARSPAAAARAAGRGRRSPSAGCTSDRIAQRSDSLIGPARHRLRPRRRHPHRPDRHRRRLAHDAAARALRRASRPSSRSAPTSPTAR